jgi:hypothetical protein
MLDISAAQRGSKIIAMFHILAVSAMLLASCFGKSGNITERYSVTFTTETI